MSDEPEWVPMGQPDGCSCGWIHKPKAKRDQRAETVDHSADATPPLRNVKPDVPDVRA